MSEQIQTHAFIFLCLILRKILHFDSVARGEVAVWHLVERCITEALGLQQMMFYHRRQKHGIPGSSWIINCLRGHVCFCSVSLIEYYHGPTDFNGIGRLSKNSTCRLEIIKTRSEVTDTPSSPEEPNFILNRRENPAPIPVNLLYLPSNLY